MMHVHVGNYLLKTLYQFTLDTNYHIVMAVFIIILSVTKIP